MTLQYQVISLAPAQLYGGAWPAIMEKLKTRYETECGCEIRHWVLWVFSNGGAVPVPTQIDGLNMPVNRVCQLMRETLEELLRVEMHWHAEADRFVLITALDQLRELGSLKIITGEA